MYSCHKSMRAESILRSIMNRALTLLVASLALSAFPVSVNGDKQESILQLPSENDAHILLRNSHRIGALPGQPAVNFSQFGGHIPVSNGRSLYYYFVESERSPEQDPLVLWLNGGPGCSSLGDGALAELGPFYPQSDGESLRVNPYAWNRVANVIFLESPAGVGFSFFTDPADNTVGDERTATDAYEFLLGFLSLYPEFADRDFYIAGESYAGHYIPQLATVILDKNADPHTPKIAVKGFLVGNAWTDSAIDNKGAVSFWWSHALISDASYRGLLSSCNFSEVGPLRAAANDWCDTYAGQAFLEMGLGRVSIYDIYADTCLGYGKSSRHFASQLVGMGPGSLSSRGLLTAQKANDACIEYEVDRYLNLPQVQEALHVSDFEGRWYDCSDTLDYSREDLLTSVLPLYPKLLASGIRILIYSGDIDAIVPVTGTREWLRTLNLPITMPWHPWFHDEQVGGYVTEYENLTFTTIRQAGHMVPLTQPERALHLFSSFLDAKPL